jgi:hypothetical protein
MTVTHTLRRQTTITKQEDWDKRSAGYAGIALPYLQAQPGFVAHAIQRDGDSGAMVETTTWASAEDCRSFVRGGSAATAATWLDGFLPTAPYPNGTWVRETVDA